jgi:ribonuclease D
VAYLDAARSALGELSKRVGVPTENLVTPDLVRRLCWDWTATADVSGTVAEFLSVGGARNWQRELVVPALSGALSRALIRDDDESVDLLGD